MSKKNCDHQKTVHGHWAKNPSYDPAEAEVGGFTGDPYEWVEEHTVRTVVDVDVHNMRCTQCDEIIPYSGSKK